MNKRLSIASIGLVAAVIALFCGLGSNFLALHASSICWMIVLNMPLFLGIGLIFVYLYDRRLRSGKSQR